MENKTVTPVINTPSSVISNKKRVNFWIFSTLTLLLVSAGLLTKLLFLNQPTNYKGTPASNNDATKETPKFSLSFSKQNLEQPLSQYNYALLASPDVLNQQRGKTWQPLECLYPSETRDTYSLSDVKKFVTDNVLLNGLQSVEDYKYKITIKNEDGSLSKEFTSLQNIGYTEICKDTSNYYVLYLTTGEKQSTQGSLLVEDVHAAGGWSGQSNFAIIPFTGAAKIYEGMNGISKNIAVSDLLKAGFSSPTSRNFAFYACRSLVGKLGEDLYAICGGEGGSGLLKITLNPISFKEVSFCWSQTSENARVCYDTQGKVYYTYK